MDQGDRIILIIDTVITEVGGSLSASTSEMFLLSMFGSRHRALEEFYALINECGSDVAIASFTGGTEESDGMMVIEVLKLRSVHLVHCLAHRRWDIPPQLIIHLYETE